MKLLTNYKNNNEEHTKIACAKGFSRLKYIRKIHGKNYNPALETITSIGSRIKTASYGFDGVV